MAVRITDDETSKQERKVQISREKMDVLFNLSEMEVETGGIVVDEEVARSTPCHGYKEDKTELVWSPGIVGALNEAEKVKYCQLRIDWKPIPEGLKRRWKALREAGVKFPKRKSL